LYLRTFVPLFGRLFCGDSETHAYIYESLVHYPEAHELAERMRGAGARDVRVAPLLGGCMCIHRATKC
jgi:ubiquinone/menaquinone biosynthesis C-methylase UbiE